MTPTSPRPAWLLVLLAGAVVVALLWTQPWQPPHDPTPEGPPSAPAIESEETPAAAVLRGAPRAANAAPNRDDNKPKRTRTRPAPPKTAPPSPPRTLELQVLLNNEPAARGSAVLFAHPLDAIWIAAREPDHDRMWDSDGVVRFDDLDQGGWIPGIRLRGGGIMTFDVAVVSDVEPNERVMVHLGTSEIFGTVYSEHGATVEGAVVVATQQNARTHKTVQTTTNALGRYRIGSLSGATTELRMTLPHRTTTTFVKTAIPKPGESVDVTWGSTRPAMRITGLVCCEDGTPVRGPGALSLHLHREHEVLFSYDKDGRFEEFVPPGRYVVKVFAPARNGPTTDTSIDVDTAMTGLRWAIPGTRVTGTVQSARRSTLPPNCAVYLNPTKGIWTVRHASRVPIVAGTYVAYGLKPGTYRLRAWIPGSAFVGWSSVTIADDKPAEITHHIKVESKPK